MRRQCLLAVLLAWTAVSCVSAQQAAISSAAPVSIGVSLQGNRLTVDAQVAQATTVTVWCPVTPGLVHFSGLTARAEFAYDSKARLLQLTLPPGKCQVVIRPLP